MSTGHSVASFHRLPEEKVDNSIVPGSVTGWREGLREIGSSDYPSRTPISRATLGIPVKTPQRQKKDLMMINNATLPVHGHCWTKIPAQHEERNRSIKATWLGHACFILKLQFVPSLGRGARVLFDLFFGLKGYTAAPCKIEEIVEVDAVVISAVQLNRGSFWW
ncbi:hypothetical protein IW261DRAFT_1594290 [Armillaria novae-zelandiae]|uniref:Uncharacterized protein n=1 Tax=Armillaria novae-zelandiae TaxID=153914 RepID=A0AA39P575_9AGAR|nr:hypothetical protein IW261DRAFT_1594290 [Armillaria novae-zelandiae]